MKPTDLMIGDLVLLFDKDFARIDSIADTCVYLTDTKGLDWNVEYNYIKPIPLTPEILEKNGYKMFALNEDEAVGFCGKWWSNDGDVMVKKFKFKYMGDMFYMSSRNSKISNIRSVHQLQHALRLVGIDKEITI